MTAPTLTEFLLARIAEDEARAKAGFSGQADPENGWGISTHPALAGFTITPHVGHAHESVQAEHIARHNPARVLAECEAKRRIVYHLQADAHLTSAVEGLRPMVSTTAILQHLAAVYADHPDYDEAWRAKG